MKRLLVLVVPFILSGFSLGGEITTVGTHYIDKPIKESYHTYRENLQTIGSFKGHHCADNIDFHFRVSNRYRDTFIESISLKYSDRVGNLTYSVEGGYIPTVQGVFSTEHTFEEQLPFIRKNSAIYNNEWMGGFLDNTAGVRAGVGYLVNGNTLINLRHTTSKGRELDKDKTDATIWGYGSDYADLTHRDLIRHTELFIDYKNVLQVFYAYTEMSLHHKQLHNLSGTDLFKEYGKTKDVALSTTPTPYDVKVNRFGLTYRSNDITFGYERSATTVTNDSINLVDKNAGEFFYAAYNIGDRVTSYASFGANSNNKTSRVYYEKSVGTRWFIDDRWSTIIEYEKSSWVQYDTVELWQKYLAQDSRTIELVSLQVLYRF